LEDDSISKEELLENMEQGWEDFNAYLDTLSPEQLTEPTDAAGWTAKDHVIHLAAWEDGVYALLVGLDRWEQMGVDRETWDTNDYDAINAVLHEYYYDLTPAEVLGSFKRTHQRLVKTIKGLHEDDLALPYNTYEPGSRQDHPVILTIVGNTYEHYEEHQPWIEAIVG